MHHCYTLTQTALKFQTLNMKVCLRKTTLNITILKNNKLAANV